MAKPTTHRGKWRIRWTAETGKGRAEVYETYDDAEFHAGRHQAHVLEVQRGLCSVLPRGVNAGRRPLRDRAA